MRAYTVWYMMHSAGETKEMSFLANNKEDAHDKAEYELIPQKEGSHPYAVWVKSVTYQNGNYRTFNTGCGNPY